MKKENKEKSKFAQSLSLVAELGYSISLPIIAGAFLGRLLDDKFSSSPILTLSLIFLGMIIGFVNMYSLIKKIE